jgi:hypothetical protein
VSQIFHHSTRPRLDELELAAEVLGDGGEEPIVRSPRGSRVISDRQRLAAVAVLGEREAHLSAVQRLALVDAAAWWLSEPNGDEEFADALLAASCAAEVTTERAGPARVDLHPRRARVLRPVWKQHFGRPRHAARPEQPARPVRARDHFARLDRSPTTMEAVDSRLGVRR